MRQKEKAHEQLPVYEVEFIPVERRLQERRATPPGAVPVERRQSGRRKSDLPPDPKTAKPHAPGKPPRAK